MGIPITEIVQTVQGGAAQRQGTFVHPYVAVNLGQWCSPSFAAKVSQWVIDRFSAKPIMTSGWGPSPSGDGGMPVARRAKIPLALSFRQAYISPYVRAKVQKERWGSLFPEVSHRLVPKISAQRAGEPNRREAEGTDVRGCR